MTAWDKLEKLAVLDIETSGLDFVSNQTLSIAVVPFVLNAPPFEVFVRHPQINWSPVARQYFAGYQQDWEDKAVTPERACRKLVQYVRTHFSGPLTIVAHNVAFDFAFLRKTFQQAGVQEKEAFSHRALDTHTLLYAGVLKGMLPDRVLSSSGAFEYFGISPSIRSRHTALGDALATRELLNRVLEVLGIGQTVPQANTR